MTPKEKAKELIERFTFICKECDYDWNAKQCALIAVDLAIEVETGIFKGKVHRSFWQEVKYEIEKL